MQGLGFSRSLFFLGKSKKTKAKEWSLRRALEDKCQQKIEGMVFKEVS